MEQASLPNLRISSIQSSSPSLKKLSIRSTLMIIAIILMTLMISPHYCWIPLYLRPSSYFSSNGPLNSVENVTNSVINGTINMAQSTTSNLATSKPALSMPQSTITGYLNNQPQKRPKLPTPKPNPSLKYHYYQHYPAENNTDKQKNNSNHSYHNTNNTWMGNTDVHY